MRIKKFIPITAVLVAIIGIFVLIEIRLYKVKEQLVNYVANDAAASAVTQGVEKALDQYKIKYNDIVSFTYDENENIKSVVTDFVSLNRFGNLVGSEIDSYINDMKVYTMRIPVTSIFRDELISGIGFNMPVRFTMTAISSTNFTNEFTSAGVNQTLHRIMLEISVKSYVVSAGKVYTVKYKTNVCVTESIIVGVTPGTFATLR